MSLQMAIFGAAAMLLQAQFPTFGSDMRLMAIDYRPEQVVAIETAPGYKVAVLLSPDEHIESIAVGDAGAWQVTANGSGDMLFVKLTQPGPATNMTVVTDVRRYVFDLLPLVHASSTMPYLLQFTYPVPGEEGPGRPGKILAEYRMSGNKSLWPSAIGDDGRKTYIEWPENAEMPAVYALDQSGREVLVNGMVRGGHYVMDSVASRLVFRIDKRVARARREPVRDEGK